MKVDQIAQLRRDITRKIVPGQVQPIKVAQFGRDFARKIVSGEVQRHKVGQVAQLGRDFARKIVPGQVQPMKVDQIAQLRRDITRKAVENRPPQFIIEAPAQVEPDHPALPVRSQSIPILQRRLRQPVGVVDPVRTVGRVVERFQSRSVRILCRDRHRCRPRRRARARSDRDASIAGRRHQTRGVHGSHRRVAGRPRHGGACHYLPVLVLHLGRESGRRSKGGQRGGSRADRHRCGYGSWRRRCRLHSPVAAGQDEEEHPDERHRRNREARVPSRSPVGAPLAHKRPPHPHVTVVP